jgi:hypothetical protein
LHKEVAITAKKLRISINNFVEKALKDELALINNKKTPNTRFNWTQGNKPPSPVSEMLGLQNIRRKIGNN